MNKRRSNYIKSLIDNQDMGLLIAIRNRHGIKTAKMNRRQIEKAAKTLWNECKGDWSKITSGKGNAILTKAKAAAKLKREKDAIAKTQKIAEHVKARRDEAKEELEKLKESGGNTNG